MKPEHRKLLWWVGFGLMLASVPIQAEWSWVLWGTGIAICIGCLKNREIP